LIYETFLINNFLTDNERRLKFFKGHSGSWSWQHVKIKVIKRSPKEFFQKRNVLQVVI